MTKEEITATAFHEAAHFLGCAYFQVRAFPEVTPEGLYSPGSTVQHAGLCHIPDPLTAYQACVVGWSGPLGQCLAGAFHDWMPKFIPTQKTLRDWFLMMLARLENLSDEDARMIRGGQRKIWLACKSAFKLLSRDKVRLKRIARYLASDAEKRQITLNNESIMTELFQKPESLELPDRQQVLKDFLSRMSADDPARPQFQKMLESLERNEKLPDEVAASV
jgi:hypothetical protein